MIWFCLFCGGVWILGGREEGCFDGRIGLDWLGRLGGIDVVGVEGVLVYLD